MSQFSAPALLRALDAAGAVALLGPGGTLRLHERLGPVAPALHREVAARAAELRPLVWRFASVAGYTRGATRWHVVVPSGTRLSWLCGLGLVWPDAVRARLPRHSARDRLCGHCIRSLVQQELALLDLERRAEEHRPPPRGVRP